MSDFFHFRTLRGTQHLEAWPKGATMYWQVSKHMDPKPASPFTSLEACHGNIYQENFLGDCQMGKNSVSCLVPSSREDWACLWFPGGSSSYFTICGELSSLWTHHFTESKSQAAAANAATVGLTVICEYFNKGEVSVIWMLLLWGARWVHGMLSGGCICRFCQDNTSVAEPSMAFMSTCHG